MYLACSPKTMKEHMGDQRKCLIFISYEQLMELVDMLKTQKEDMNSFQRNLEMFSLLAFGTKKHTM